MLNVLDSIAAIEEAEALAAIREYKALRTLLEAMPADIAASEPTLIFLRSFADYMTGREADAYERLIELVTSFVGDREGRLYRRILNLQGILEVELGNLDCADEVFSAVQSAAELANDHRYVAYATLNRGIICDIRGDPQRAIVAFERARNAFQWLGDGAGIAGCCHNLGMAYRRLNEFSAADSFFLAAIDYFNSNGSAEELLASTIERALVLSLGGEALLGRAAAQMSLAEAEAMRNRRLVGESARVLGKTAMLLHEDDTALSMLTLALEVGKEHRLRLLEAEALIDLAALASSQGARSKERELLTSAAGLFLRMGALTRAKSIRGGS